MELTAQVDNVTITVSAAEEGSSPQVRSCP